MVRLKRTGEIVEMLRDLRESGMTVKQVAQAFEVRTGKRISTSTVHAWTTGARDYRREHKADLVGPNEKHRTWGCVSCGAEVGRNRMVRVGPNVRCKSCHERIKDQGAQGVIEFRRRCEREDLRVARMKKDAFARLSSATRAALGK